MTVFKDQMGRSVELNNWPPTKIISLVPSQTELLFDLEAGPSVKGITKFCIHPKELTNKVRKVGGTKSVHFDRIDEIQPDLIIGNKEENEKEMIQTLAQKYPVWMSDILTLEDAYDMIQQIGLLIDKEAIAINCITKIKERFAIIPQPTYRPRVAYFIWRNPYMLAANNTFINVMLQKAGFQNAFEELSRYPSIPLSQLNERKVDFVFLSSEPYPFKTKHFGEFTRYLSEDKLRIVDGELFSWYGSRLYQSASYFHQLAISLKN
ncbi:MAG: helical backbone metal receptor [Bacteroidota bacterium]